MLGQIDCQTLNRALALPAVVKAMFGRPDVLFAPNPSEMKSDQGHLYSYFSGIIFASTDELPAKRSIPAAI